MKPPISVRLIGGPCHGQERLIPEGCYGAPMSFPLFVVKDPDVAYTIEELEKLIPQDSMYETATYVLGDCGNYCYASGVVDVTIEIRANATFRIPKADGIKAPKGWVILANTLSMTDEKDGVSFGFVLKKV